MEHTFKSRFLGVGKMALAAGIAIFAAEGALYAEFIAEIGGPAVVVSASLSAALVELLNWLRTDVLKIGS